MVRSESVTRRGFLQGIAAAWAAPYVVPASALGMEGATPANSRIVICSVGVGNMGGGHVKSLVRHRDAMLVGICDVDQKTRELRVAACNKDYTDQGMGGAVTYGYSDYREVMTRGDIDAVIVATPDQNHAIVAIAALQSGKDVYCEKPMTLTIAEGRRMADAAARYKRVFQCGSQRRSDPRQRRACELVRNGRIGRLLRVEVGVGLRPTKAEPAIVEPVPPGFDYELWLGPAPWAPYCTKRCHYNFRFVRDYSGGEMTNFGAHFLDIAQWGIGADDSGPVEVEGRGEFFDGLWNTFAKVDVEYTYANGVKLHCTSGPGGSKFFGTEGWVDADRFAAEPRSLLTSIIAPDEIHLYDSGKAGHLGNFLECVRSRRPTAAPAEVGHRSATVCHLGNLAMTLGRRLRWDPQAERFPGDDEANRLLWRPYREPYTL